MRFYFAYGSNMARHQMKRRCPAARAVGPARLDGWRFIVNRRGTASIIPEDGAEVHGVLWRTTRVCIATLDVFEGVVKGRYRKLLVAVEHDGMLCQALVYAGRFNHRGRPIRAYLEGTVLPAARAWALPQPYLEELQAWMPHVSVGPTRPRPGGRSWRP